MPPRVVVLIGGGLLVLAVAFMAMFLRAPEKARPPGVPAAASVGSVAPSPYASTASGAVARAPGEATSSQPSATVTSVPCKMPPTSPADLTALTAAEQIPAYPGAQAVSLDTNRAYFQNTPISATTYLTQDSYEVVERFYRTQLARLGWAETLDGAPLAFRWTDATGAIPWKLRFDLSLQETLDGLEATTVLQGIPDVSAVPLYPGAVQTTVETRTPENEFSINCVIHYRVGVPPLAVRAFYEHNLARYGWRLPYPGFDNPDPAFHLGTPPLDPYPDVHFETYLHPSCTICGGSASVIVNASPAPDGGSQVTIYTSGAVEELLCRCSDIPNGR